MLKGLTLVVLAFAAMDWNAIARMPREDAIAMAYSSTHSEFRPGILSIVFGLWAREDPGGAHARLRLLPSEPAVARVESQVIKVWMARDPRRAIEAAVESGSAETFAMAMNDYAHQHPERALAMAQNHVDQLGPAEWRGIIRGIADTRPDLAAEHVASLGRDGEYLLEEFIGHLIRRDPGGTFDWLLAHFPDNHDHIEAIATAFFVQSPADAFAYLAEMRDGATRRAYRKSLCRAKSVNEESRAASRLPQPPPGYADGVCPRRVFR